MLDLLFWLYLTNATILIVHEIDSAYWKEWDLFRLPGGLSGFLLIHIPLVFILLYGVIMVYRGETAGLIISLVLSGVGIFAFCIHTYFLRRGKPEFNSFVSKLILFSTLLVSIAQAVAAITALRI